MSDIIKQNIKPLADKLTNEEKDLLRSEPNTPATLSNKDWLDELMDKLRGSQTEPSSLQTWQGTKQAILSKLESIEQEAVDRERSRLTHEAYEHERKKMSEYIDTILHPNIRVYRQVGDITYIDQIKDINYGGEIITVVVEGKG